MTLDGIDAAAAAAHLAVFGAVHDAGTVVLLGPKEPGFWAHVTSEPEFRDGAADPIDRWSSRVITALAVEHGAEPLFPFGGPPWHPFIRWAGASGRAWPSPVGMLVHDTAGLMVSYRGALRFAETLHLPPPATRPCESCVDQPCLTACPVNALSAKSGYYTDACHGFLNSPEGQSCLSLGCAARRSCPVSQSYGRVSEQSAFHMAQFHPQ